MIIKLKVNLARCLKEVLAESFSDEAVKGLISHAADIALKQAIHEQVQAFFRVGEGREAVKREVEKKLGGGG